MASELPAALGDLARCQDGVVSRPQALQSGLSVDQVKFRVTSGRWQPLYPGVYATFAGPPRRGTRLWAALLRAGPGAALSYLTAAELHGLADQRSDQIHVTVPHERRVVAAPGLTVHRCRRAGLEIDPGTRPPRTTVEETVLDLAQQSESLDEACGWATRALVRELTDAARLRAAMTARRTLRWRTDLDTLIAAAARTRHPRPNPSQQPQRPPAPLPR